MNYLSIRLLSLSAWHFETFSGRFYLGAVWIIALEILQLVEQRGPFDSRALWPLNRLLEGPRESSWQFRRF